MRGSDELKEILSGIFDSQIPNHGDYNLVFASAVPEPGTAGNPGPCYVLGYRWRPHELVIAPVDPAGPAAAGTPVAIDMTNLSHAVQLAGRHAAEPDPGTIEYEVGNSTGRIFRFEVAGEGVLPGSGSIEQVQDAEDFHQFMASLISMA
ncbi:hypothetical protein [Arthrobacter mobilis]|uniref:Uncharacterized protein n=1 Tax=Arthrobacter mobilis TaxID=2724944 RepID=A0A7X6HCU2_9MICC|nr:hypothetical protein [Arthrobacter mobilis]NKX54646.1 hypothetical protein [Arthrobacter mobilis]